MDPPHPPSTGTAGPGLGSVCPTPTAGLPRGRSPARVLAHAPAREGEPTPRGSDGNPAPARDTPASCVGRGSLGSGLTGFRAPTAAAPHEPTRRTPGTCPPLKPRGARRHTDASGRPLFLREETRVHHKQAPGQVRRVPYLGVAGAVFCPGGALGSSVELPRGGQWLGQVSARRASASQRQKEASVNLEEKTRTT